MNAGGGFWSLLTIVGPIALIVVLAWVILNNKRKPRDIARTEEATRANYEAQDAEDKRNEVK